MNGIIVKAISGFYYVKTPEKIFQCKARGIFKKDKTTPLVGDQVVIEITHRGDEEGIINEILPRKNQFIRPPVSNVDCFLTVISFKDPEPNLFILDRFLAMAEKAQTEIVICLNKIDLSEKDELEKIKQIYSNIYPIICISCKTGEGIDKLSEYLKDKKSALAGPSGVGKSSILNRIFDSYEAETGEVSRKLKRGKHTTRHVELFSLSTGGMVYDTPGFTSFDVLDCDEEEIGFCYPEINKIAGNCKYDNCRHISEPHCKIIQGVKDGEIHQSRYNSYVTLVNEIRENEKNKW